MRKYILAIMLGLAGCSYNKEINDGHKFYSTSKTVNVEDWQYSIPNDYKETEPLNGINTSWESEDHLTDIMVSYNIFKTIDGYALDVNSLSGFVSINMNAVGATLVDQRMVHILNGEKTKSYDASILSFKKNDVMVYIENSVDENKHDIELMCFASIDDKNNYSCKNILASLKHR